MSDDVEGLPPAPQAITPEQVAEAITRRMHQARDRVNAEGPRQPYPVWLPKPPAEEGDDDNAEGWALYAADLFRARGDWRMVRAASGVAQALAAAGL